MKSGTDYKQYVMYSKQCQNRNRVKAGYLESSINWKLTQAHYISLFHPPAAASNDSESSKSSS
jgi:hypothetical protein